MFELGVGISMNIGIIVGMNIGKVIGKDKTPHTSQKEESFLREQKTLDLRRFCNF